MDVDLALVYLILKVLGSLYALRFILVWIAERLGFFTWFRMRRQCLVLIEKIRDAPYIPDLVVGLGRSGAILGGIIAGNLGVLPIATVDREYRLSEGGARSVIPRLMIDREIIKGKRVLLVDALPHTGDTMRVIAEELKKCGPSEMKTASLYVEKYCIQRPDFYLKVVKKVRRLPWRFTKAWREDFLLAKEE